MPVAERVPATAVVPLRTAVLRPGWTDRLATYPEDADASTVHLAAFRDGAVVSVGTVYPEAPPDAHRGAVPDAAWAPGAAWRLRGMASAPDVRGAGYGAAVLSGVLGAVADARGGFLWCNARLVAVPFYERAGMQTVGDEFDIPEIGPHYVMWCAVAQSR